MNSIMKRILSVALIIVMVFGMLPAGVIHADAAEADEGIVAKIGDTGYATFDEAITAANGMTGDVVVEIYGKVDYTASTANLSGTPTSISFVGKTADAEISITRNGYNGYISGPGSAPKVNFKDLSLSKPAGAFVNDTGFMNVAFTVYRTGEVTYTNCTFPNGACAAGAKTTYTGCTFKKSHDKYGLWAYGTEVLVDSCTFDDDRGIKMYAEDKAKTTDLTVKNTDFSAVNSKPAIVLTYGERVTLENNTYSSKGVFELDLDGEPNGTPVSSTDKVTCVNDNGACGVLVDGKIYTTVAQAAEVAASGSTVTLLHDSTETVELPEGVTLDKNGYTADSVTVVYVAYIGKQGYKTLQAAIDAAVAGETVTLMDNVTLTEILTIDKAITLNGNGKKLTSSAGRAINISGADGVTIQNLTVEASGERAFNVIQNATNVTIKDVTATAANYTVNVASSAPKAVVTIKNSDLTGLNVVNIAAAGADITVSNSKLTCNDQTEVESYAALVLNIDAAGAQIKATECTFDIKGDSAKASNNTADGKIIINNDTEAVENGVGYISYGDYHYTSTDLASLVAVAKDGETIVLIRDVTLSEILTIDKAITLDGNGKTLTSSAGRAINISGADGVTIQNLTVEASGERAFNVIQNATNVTIKDVTATAANYTVNVASSAPKAVITIENSDLTGLNVVNIAAAGADITVSNSKLTCNDQTEVESYAALVLNIDAAGAQIKATECTFDIKGDSAKASNNTADGKIIINNDTEAVENGVGYISYGDYHYTSTDLASLVAVAKDGETIVLIRDVTLSEILTVDKAITLDGNGKTLTLNGELKVFGEATVNDVSISGTGKIIIDATGMDLGEYTNIGADLSGFTGTVEVINNELLGAEIQNGKIVLNCLHKTTHGVPNEDGTTHNVVCSNEGCDYAEANVAHTGGVATCTEPGKCEACEASYIDPLGHIDADNDHICDRKCGVEDLSGHTGTLVEGQAATCTVDGWKDYFECSCGKLFEDVDCAKEISDLDAWKAGAGKIAASHAYGEPAWTWAEDNSAVLTLTCANDEEHILKPEVTVTSATTDATCEEAGKTVYTASAEFGDVTVTDTKEVEIPATGHSFPSWVDGQDKRVCSVCGKIETRVIIAEDVVTDVTEVGIETPADTDVSFNVEVIPETDESYSDVEDTVGDVYESNEDVEGEVVIVLDVSVEGEVEEDTSFTVKLYGDWDPNANYVVYHVSDDGKHEQFEVINHGEYLEFTTTHFSIYVLVEEVEPAVEPEDPEPEEPKPEEPSVPSTPVKPSKPSISISGIINKWFENWFSKPNKPSEPSEPSVPCTPVKPIKPIFSNIFSWITNWWKKF